MIRESEPPEVGPEDETSIISWCQRCGNRYIHRPDQMPKCDRCGFIPHINAKMSGVEMTCND